MRVQLSIWCPPFGIEAQSLRVFLLGGAGGFSLPMAPSQPLPSGLGPEQALFPLAGGWGLLLQNAPPPVPHLV